MRNGLAPVFLWEFRMTMVRRIIRHPAVPVVWLAPFPAPFPRSSGSLALVLLEGYRHRFDQRPRSSSSVRRSTCLRSRSAPGRCSSKLMVWVTPATSSMAMARARS